METDEFRQRRRNSPLRAIAANGLIKSAGLNQPEVTVVLNAGSGSAISRQLLRYRKFCAEDKKWNKLHLRCESTLETIIRGLGTTSSAKDEIGEIFRDRLKFQTPKPTRLIKELIRAASKKNSTVLDFFAGSGTTGHAVMDLNREDGGSRRFILINNNENNICREITYQRLKRVIVVLVRCSVAF